MPMHNAAANPIALAPNGAASARYQGVACGNKSSMRRIIMTQAVRPMNQTRMRFHPMA